MPSKSRPMHSAYVSEVDQALKDRLLDGLKFIDWKKYVKTDSIVFLKPNFTLPDYTRGVTTTPELLRRLLEIIRERTSTVIVGESDGGNNSFRAEDAFKGHQLYGFSKRLGIDLVNLSRLPSRFVESDFQGRRVKVQLPKILLDQVDCFISVPVLKIHVVTWVSLGLKNLWGCYPDSMRGLHHKDFGEKLALMAKLLDPKITVIDGLYALDKHGPMFGEPVKTDLVLLADNVVVADTLATKIMGIPLEKAKHIKVAEKRGIGTTDLRHARLNVDWRQYRMKFQMKKTFLDMISILTFESYIASKLVMESPFSPFMYKVIDRLRSPEERRIADQSSTRITNEYRHG